MNTPSFRDMQLISAYLDGQLSGKQKTRLEARLKVEPDLAGALEELRQVKALLRKTPRRRVPRNFTLTPKMAGIRPPVPRIVPAFSWASAVAAVMFLFTLGFSLLAGGALTAAPKAVSLAPMAGAGVPQATAMPAQNSAPLAPESTQAPAATYDMTVESAAPTATPELMIASGPATEPPGERSVPPSQNTQKPGIPWVYIWLGLAVVLIGAAMLIRAVSTRAFARRMRSK